MIDPLTRIILAGAGTTTHTHTQAKQARQLQFRLETMGKRETPEKGDPDSGHASRTAANMAVRVHLLS